MKKNAVGFLLVAGFVALMTIGCANQELVKKDETVAPTANTAVQPAENKEVKAPAEQTTPVQETTLNDSTKQATSKEQLQAALEKI